MAESVYKVIELVGTSEASWEKGCQRSRDPGGRVTARPSHRLHGVAGDGGSLGDEAAGRRRLGGG